MFLFLDVPLTTTGAELKQLLEDSFDIGTVGVTYSKKCYEYKWKVNWKTKSGRQPLLQVNSTKVFGENIRNAINEKEGGLFYKKVPGEFLRMPATKPQVKGYNYNHKHYDRQVIDFSLF